MLKIVLAFVAAACFSIWGLAYYQDHHATYPYPYTKAPHPDPHPETEEQINCDAEGAYTGAPLKERAEHHREFVAGCKAWLIANGRPNENPDRNGWTTAPEKTPTPQWIAQTRLDCINGDLEKFQTHYCQGWLEKDGWMSEDNYQIIVKEKTPHPSFRTRVKTYCVGKLRQNNYSEQIYQLDRTDPETQAGEIEKQQKLRILEYQLEHALRAESDCEGYLLNGWTSLPGEGEAPARKLFREQAQYDIQMGAGK